MSAAEHEKIEERGRATEIEKTTEQRKKERAKKLLKIPETSYCPVYPVKTPQERHLFGKSQKTKELFLRAVFPVFDSISEDFLLCDHNQKARPTVSVC